MIAALEKLVPNLALAPEVTKQAFHKIAGSRLDWRLSADQREEWADKNGKMFRWGWKFSLTRLSGPFSDASAKHRHRFIGEPSVTYR